MKYKNNLLKKIKNKSAKICVVGLGYVGFPLMDLIKKKGFEVVGIDTDNSKVNALKKKLFSVIFAIQNLQLLHTNVVTNYTAVN